MADVDASAIHPSPNGPSACSESEAVVPLRGSGNLQLSDRNGSRSASPLVAIALGVLHPHWQHVRQVTPRLIRHQPHRTLADFRRKRVRSCGRGWIARVGGLIGKRDAGLGAPVAILGIGGIVERTGDVRAARKCAAKVEAGPFARGDRLGADQHGRVRDRALFDLAIDSKLRGCDLVKIRISDIVCDRKIRTRATVVQQKTGRPVQFELMDDARASLLKWLELRGTPGISITRSEQSPFSASRPNRTAPAIPGNTTALPNIAPASATLIP